MQVGEGVREDEGDVGVLTTAPIRAEEDRMERIDGDRSFGRSFHGERRPELAGIDEGAAVCSCSLEEEEEERRGMER